VDYENIPAEIKQKGQRTYRSITVDGKEIEFSGGFTELHTESYKQIINGNGFGLEHARPCIEMAYEIRNAQAVGFIGEYHPLAVKK